MTDSYPRLAARTGRFSYGIPRDVTVAPDGSKVWFVRTPDGTTNCGMLWEFDVASGTETLLVDPRQAIDGHESLPPQERARRERSRESGAGIVGFAVDATGRWASFALAGQVWVVHVAARAATALSAAKDGAIDPRVDPRGRTVAYVADRQLRVIGVDGTNDRALATAQSATQSWGLAEFIAAEELDRHRGYWWAPDGTSLIVERFDEEPVSIWRIADPQSPEHDVVDHRYPAAGTANADVTLWHVDLDGEHREIIWDRATFEYVASVTWTEHGPPVLQVMDRAQRRAQILSVNVSTGTTTVIRELADAAWIDVTSPPRHGDGGELVSVEDRDGRRRVVVDGEPLGDPTWQVRQLVSTHPDCVIVTASVEPAEIHVVRFGLDGSTEPVTSGPGVHAASVGGPTTVITRSTLAEPATAVTVHGEHGARPITVVSATPPWTPKVQFLQAGPSAIRTAVVFPEGHVSGARRLPVLMNPYGGPHAQRVLASARMFLEPQWLANQGFCVVVADGRGTPGRDAQWERAVLNDLATPVLDDQITALEVVASAFPDDVDPSRVGITGWSFGGYLAALAVLRRPDVFHAAVAGAPVTEWRLYDTAYSERYLGHPADQPDVYDAASLLPLAEGLQRPLMLIHGLSDDNVYAVHTLRLSSALLAAGRPHTVIPLPGITHMASQESVAEGLALVQAAFLAQALHR